MNIKKIKLFNRFSYEESIKADAVITLVTKYPYPTKGQLIRLELDSVQKRTKNGRFTRGKTYKHCLMAIVNDIVLLEAARDYVKYDLKIRYVVTC